MDRGFVFKQINNYMNCFVPGDPKVCKLLEMNFVKDLKLTQNAASLVLLLDFIRV